MKRILLPSGKFGPFREDKKKKDLSQIIKQPENSVPVNDVKGEELPSNEGKKFALSGGETAAELKAMLDEVGVEYAKNASKDKCLELLAPFVEEEGLDEL